MRQRRLAPLLLAAVLVLVLPGTEAWAQAECETPYTVRMASDDLGVMTLALRNLDEDAFNKSGVRMDAGLPCMTVALPVAAMASAYRFLGAWRYLTGDKDTGTRWFRTAIELDPSYVWDVNDLPLSHPLRAAYEGEIAMAGQPPVVIDDMVLDPPPGTELLVDGRPLHEPALTMGRPHLLQLVEAGSQDVREAWMIDGNAVPDRYLISTKEAAQRAAALAEVDGKGRKNKKPKNKSADLARAAAADDPYAVRSVTAIRPRAKTPLLVTGAVGILASGVVYGMSYPARKRFDQATTTDDLLVAQSATNALVIASGATLAVGMGVGIVGLQLNGHPGLVIGRRF
ncbi:MAG: hypothetical protein GXP62_09505 [Oligoflexia bacterium]|nr:hypothetical protein [Oligoflexia bacterium]